MKTAIQLELARNSLKLDCLGLLVLGGPDHPQAAATIERLTGEQVEIAEDCTCRPGGFDTETTQ
ncbi:MAG: hypothetical protein GY906_38595 [bacterium]|nr:hypothetical protein [bacterium]